MSLDVEPRGADDGLQVCRVQRSGQQTVGARDPGVEVAHRGSVLGCGSDTFSEVVDVLVLFFIAEVFDGVDEHRPADFSERDGGEREHFELLPGRLNPHHDPVIERERPVQHSQAQCCGEGV